MAELESLFFLRAYGDKKEYGQVIKQIESNYYLVEIYSDNTEGKVMRVFSFWYLADSRFYETKEDLLFAVAAFDLRTGHHPIDREIKKEDWLWKKYSSKK